MMLPSRGFGRRAVVGAVGAVALAGERLSEAPRLQVPSRQRRRHLRRRIARPRIGGVRAGVAAATSAYLFTHPPVNDFFATLRGQTRRNAS